MAGPRESDSNGDPAEGLEALLVEYYRRSDAGEDDVVEALCREAPGLAGALRAKLEALGELGLLHGDGPLGAPAPGRLDDFRIVRELGSGGMGVVYVAEQLSLGRRVALKVFRSAGPAVAVERFRREARALARLDHPGVVRVHASGEAEGVLYIAMDLVPGPSLEERLGEGPLPTSAAVRIARDVARALAAVHANSIVHRDVKPSNVRLTPEGRPVLVDFGLARDLELEGLTRADVFLGTPHYAAPEQVAPDRGEVGPWTDVHGLGVVLYQCLTRSLPFAGETTEAVFHQVLAATPVPPRRRNGELSRDLETVVMKAIEKEPARRYTSAADLADDLDAVLELRAIAAVPPGPLRRARDFVGRHRAATAAVLAALAALLVFLAARELEAGRRREARRIEAEAALDSVRERLDRYRRRAESTAELEHAVRDLRVLLTRRYLESPELAELDRREAEAQLLETERELAYADMLEELRRAERLGADPGPATELRAELDLLKLLEALAAAQEGVAEFYRGRLESRGDTAAGRAAARTRGELVVDATPSPSALRLFRYDLQSHRVEGGEPRLVPVPLADAGAPFPPGTWALELTADSPPLAAGDLVLSVAGHPIEGSVLVERAAPPLERLDRLLRVDALEVRGPADVDSLTARKPEADHRFEFARGDRTLEVVAADLADLGVELATPLELARAGAPATVYTRGRIEELPATSLTGLRPTAAPLDLGPASLAGRAAVHRLALDPGTYLAVLSGEGSETVRIPVHLAAGAEHTLRVRLPPAGSRPPGFVPVFDGVGRIFFLLEHEVTCAQYLEFLEHAEIRPLVERGAGASLVPRAAVTDGLRPLWTRGADGRLRLPEGTLPDHPVTSVSWIDARTYAEWLTRRLREAGYGVSCALPGHSDWHGATNPVGGSWRYVFGPHFRPRWTLSNFAHRRPALTPVRSHPVDRTPAGAYDLAGSVMEWSASWFWEERGWRTFRCGAWSYADPERFESDFAQGEEPTWTSVAIGFRVVARPD